MMIMGALAVALTRLEEPLTVEETDLLYQRLKGLPGQGPICKENLVSIIKEFSPKRTGNANSC